MRTTIVIVCTAAVLGMAAIGYSQDAQLSELAGKALSELVNGDYAAFFSRFDDKMKAGLPQEKLPEVWKMITAQFGAFKSQGPIRQDKSGEYDVMAVNCQFEKSALDIRLIFNSRRQMSGLFFAPAASQNRSRPQNPKKPYPYREEEVSYDSKEPGIKLAGTLTFPNSVGPFPAVLLITGSGSQNRDEEIMGHKPFLVLADHLTRKGIAVLRVDDRGVGGSTMGSLNVTSQNFAQDVLAGVSYLKSRKEIDPSHIGLIGHSEGGVIAPMVAVQSPDVAFMVLMAGTGVTGEDVLYEQSQQALRLMGSSKETIEEISKVQKFALEAIKSTTDSAALEKQIRQALEGLKPETKSAMGGQLETTIRLQEATSPWLHYFVSYDPRPALEKVKCPVLAINGEKDFQVSSRQNLPAIERALRTGRNKDFKVVELPSLNHLFQTCKTGFITEYEQIEETISPSALELISGWILERVR